VSERQRHPQHKDTESGSAMRSQAQTSRSHGSDRPRRMPLAGLAGLPRRLWEAGNAAFSRLLGRRRNSGQPLAPQTRAEMERAFGSDFSPVRVHQDAGAQGAAAALDAEAFTHGTDIYLGTESPAPESPAGRALIAHELAHVVQQRQAAELEAAVSQPGDRLEQAADRAAQQAVQGQAAASPVSDMAPAIQRQPRQENRASREDARAALEAFLRRVMQQQGGRALRVTPEVRSAVTSLFIGDVGRLVTIESWLNSPALPGDPAEFAREVARRLPETIDRARIDRLNQMSGRAPAPDSMIGRAQEVAERTAPGSPEREEEREAEQVAKGNAQPTRTRIPAGEAAPPGIPTPEERIEQVEQVGRRIRGEEEPTTIGPVSVDVLHLARIWGARQEILQGPKAPRPTPPEARTYSEVERVTQQLAPETLVPAEARGTARADDFADAQLVARDLARRLDVAQQQGQESIELRLGDNYNRVRDRATIIAEIERIIQLVRDALPHHAAGVINVDVFFGNRLVSRGRARRNP
jgi:Domain of unknown function (DUF4157)